MFPSELVKSINFLKNRWLFTTCASEKGENKKNLKISIKGKGMVSGFKQLYDTKPRKINNFSKNIFEFIRTDTFFIEVTFENSHHRHRIFQETRENSRDKSRNDAISQSG